MSNRENAVDMPSWEAFEKDLMIKAMKDDDFRKGLIADPTAVVERELGKIKKGLHLKSDMKIRVVEQKPDELVVMLPPHDPSALNDEDLERIAAGFYAIPIVMGGGGPGRSSTPFIFTLQV